MVSLLFKSLYFVELKPYLSLSARKWKYSVIQDAVMQILIILIRRV